MTDKKYRKVDVLQPTKKRFDIAKVKSDCVTQDDFLNKLLDNYEKLGGSEILIDMNTLSNKHITCSGPTGAGMTYDLLTCPALLKYYSDLKKKEMMI